MKRLLAAFLRLALGHREASRPTTLRNRAGGMAWIRHCPQEVPPVLAGGIVLTTSVDERGFWAIDPPQVFVPDRHFVTLHGTLASPGERVTLVALHDNCLEPIPDTGVTEADVRELFLPRPVTSKERA